jgi:hypothetical protein
LLALLVLGTGFAAFSGGAIDIPAESRLQGAIAALVLAGGVGIAAGWLRAPRSPLAWAAIALLAAFGLWSALSESWSASPEASWIAANRAITYAALCAVALVSASSVRNAPAHVALGLAAVALLVALYALGGKVVPGLHLGPLDLNPGDRFARLREPIDYWNALGLLCVMACPVLIWLAASRTPIAPVRLGALLGLGLIVLTAALTYSRGAIIAYVVVLAVLVGAGPRRLPRLAVGIGVPLLMAPSMLIAFGRHDLSSSDVALSARESDGLILAAVVVVSLLALAILGRELIRFEPRVAWTPRRSRLVWRGLAAAAALLLVAAAVALGLSGRGLGGEISHQVDEFSKPQGLPANTPERLISSNGSNRYIWWQEAIGAFKDKPIAGWGAGSFPVLHYLYRRYDAPVRSTHSLPLQFLSETGLVGALVGLSGLALLGVAAIGQVRRSAGVERSARLVLVASAAAWAAHSLYDWDWEIPAVTVPALIALCAAAAPSPRPLAPPRPLRRAPAILAGAATALAAAALATSAALPALSQGERLQALDAAAAGKGSLDQAGDDARRAHDLDPLSIDPLFTEASVARAQRRGRLAVSYLQQAADTEPDSWQTWVRLARAEVQLGDRAGAVEAVRRWTETDPLRTRPLRPSLAASLFELTAPPSASPTAYGTPP